MELQCFHYTIRYRPGETQDHVDCLSRLPQVAGIRKIRGAIIKEREELREAVRTGDCPAWMTPALLQYVEEIDNEIIDNNGLKVVGPIETREILTQIHESPFDGGHLGAQKNLQKFRQYYIGH